MLMRIGAFAGLAFMHIPVLVIIQCSVRPGGGNW